MPAKPINQFMKELTEATSLGDNDLVLINKADGSLYGATQSSSPNSLKTAGGYTVSGNTLIVTDGDSETLTDRWNALYDNELGLGVPASNNKVVMKIQDGVYTTQTFTYYPEDSVGDHIIIVTGEVVLGVTFNPTSGSKP